MSQAMLECMRLSRNRERARIRAIWVDGPDSEAVRAARWKRSEPRMRGLVEQAVRNAGIGEDRHLPRWSAVGCAFGLGSRSATALCREFGVDPDEEVGNPTEEDFDE